MIVSGVQQSDTVIHIYIYIYIYVPILFQILFTFKLLFTNIELNSLCYTVHAFWLSILNIAVGTWQCHTPNHLFYLPVPIGNCKFIR